MLNRCMCRDVFEELGLQILIFETILKRETHGVQLLVPNYKYDEN